MMSKSWRMYSRPVSYTHLDVYKRQVGPCLEYIRHDLLIIAGGKHDDGHIGQVSQPVAQPGQCSTGTILVHYYQAGLLYIPLQALVPGIGEGRKSHKLGGDNTAQLLDVHKRQEFQP